jgi:hypothetical protein
MFAPTSMFRWTACLTALCAVALITADLGAVPPQTAATQTLPANARFVSIFNGKDLTGWHVDRVPADDALAPKLFAVQNGELTLDTPGTSDFAWLTYDKELKDFALRLEFVAYQDAKGNCGIQFRDKWSNNEYPRHGFDLRVERAGVHGLHLGLQRTMAALRDEGLPCGQLQALSSARMDL